MAKQPTPAGPASGPPGSEKRAAKAETPKALPTTTKPIEGGPPDPAPEFKPLPAMNRDRAQALARQLAFANGNEKPDKFSFGTPVWTQYLDRAVELLILEAFLKDEREIDDVE